MNRNRAGLVALLSGVLFTFATEPALAQTADSSTDELIWGLNFDLLAIAIPITILVEAILFYTVWRFRSSNVEEAKPTKENRRLEITWTVATAIVLLFVGVGAYSVIAAEDPSGPADVTVEVQGQQFFWQYEYPEDGVSTDSDRGELVLPVNQSVRMEITSSDVAHAFHVPELGWKSDAIPGKTNVIQSTPQKVGTYQLYCAEYCGSGHSKMLGTVNVTTQEKYEAWLAENSEDAAASDEGNETAPNGTTAAPTTTADS